MKTLIIAAFALIVSVTTKAQNKQQPAQAGARPWQDTATYVIKLKMWDLNGLASKVAEHAQLIKGNAINRTAEQIAADAKVIKEDEQLYEWLSQQLQVQMSRHQWAEENKKDPPKKQ